MPFRGRNMTRELGAAFAVLALYVLVLLAPLHQAAGLQRDLAALGHPAWDQFSVCTSLSRADPGERPAPVKCAAAGIGQNTLPPPASPAISLGTERLAGAVVYRDFEELFEQRVERATAQARAPPHQV